MSHVKQDESLSHAFGLLALGGVVIVGPYLLAIGLVVWLLFGGHL